MTSLAKENIINLNFDSVTIRKYPAYKYSGVEWLGEIPSDWEILPGLSFIFENKDRNKGMVRNTILSLSYGNIRIKGEDELTGLVPESFETYQFVNKGDLIFRPTDLQNDTVSLRSSISEFDGIITNAYLNLRFKSKANSKFFHYFFRAIDNNKVIYGLGSGLRQNISYLDFRRFQFPFPPLPEQTAIAAFLDRKTALINQAIDIKQKQIELLKERRQILIHKAVTRGLNPNVKMKDSGVEWIGEIPEHWEVFELKRLINPKRRITYGIVQPGEPDPQGRYMIRGQDYSKGWADRESLFRVSNRIEEPYKRARVIPGDIIITIVGAGCGNLEIIPEWLDGANLTQTTARVAIDQNAYWSKYVYFTLLSNVGVSQMRLYIKGAAQPGLNLEHIKIYKLPIPLYQEQIEISNYIESIEHSFTTAISLKEQEIEKLKEYKASLINSAVTGKIKVC
jgi:type I restriction enzyme S subunit